MVSGVYWSVGARAVNEDTVVLEAVHTDMGKCTLMVVCDGIGSLPHGEVVSGYVSECLIRWFYGAGLRMYHCSVRKIRRSLRKCIYDCHMELKETAKSLGISWGTTCTCVYIRGSRYICMHLGDSAAFVFGRMCESSAFLRIRRAYLSGAGVEQITGVHVNARNELVRCVGSMGYFEPDFHTGRLCRGSGILVASDGFAGNFGLREMGECLCMGADVTQERLEHRLAGLGNEAAARGCGDNRSAVCVIM
ncbi:MAG: protein serine/threonine phosphatase 2C family protein [Lachnospiraceae bacterium]|nr:protein serine/threonine phosphatase 2C family protein [Lachnospiraceae bacterium]